MFNIKNLNLYFMHNKFDSILIKTVIYFELFEFIKWAPPNELNVVNIDFSEYPW